MTVTTTSAQNTYSGNGTTTVFAYEYKIDDEDDLEVVVADADDAQTTLTITTYYTVSSVGNDSGGNVTLGDLTAICAASELPTGWTLSIRRIVDITQETDLANQGTFSQETHEDVFDKMVMIAQQQQNELDRCPKVTETSGDSGDDLMDDIEGYADAAAASETAAGLSEVAAALAETNAETAETAAEAAQTAVEAYYTPVATETITAAGTIAVTQSSAGKRQFRRITGDGAVTTADAPFGTTTTYFVDGMEIKLETQSDTNTVLINSIDMDYGALLNGNWQGGKGGVLKLCYNSTLKRFIEVCRNK